MDSSSSRAWARKEQQCRRRCCFITLYNRAARAHLANQGYMYLPHGLNSVGS
jgi:hypothetical protein